MNYLLIILGAVSLGLGVAGMYHSVPAADGLVLDEGVAPAACLADGAS